MTEDDLQKDPESSAAQRDGDHAKEAHRTRIWTVISSSIAFISSVFAGIINNTDPIHAVWLLFVFVVAAWLAVTLEWTGSIKNKQLAVDLAVKQRTTTAKPEAHVFLEKETVFVRDNKPILENSYVIEYRDGDSLGGSRRPVLHSGVYGYGPRKQPFSIGKFRVINERDEPVSDIRMVMGLRIWPNKTGSDDASVVNAPVLPWVVTIPKRIYKGPENAFEFYVISYSTKQPIDVFLPDVASGITEGPNPITVPAQQLQGAVPGFRTFVNLMMFEPPEQPNRKKKNERPTNQNP